MSFAARRDAVVRNPVRETAPISAKPKEPPTSPELEELGHLLALLTYDGLARRRDLPDFARFMAATGLRIGEASAITWTNLDPTGASRRSVGAATGPVLE